MVMPLLVQRGWTRANISSFNLISNQVYLAQEEVEAVGGCTGMHPTPVWLRRKNA